MQLIKDEVLMYKQLSSKAKIMWADETHVSIRLLEGQGKGGYQILTREEALTLLSDLEEVKNETDKTLPQQPADTGEALT